MKPTSPATTSAIFDDETLVAYLDGELPAEDSERISSRLDSDSSLRHRVEGLRKTWDLLLELPEPEPNPELTRSTIEIVALQLDAPESETKATWLGRLAAKKWLVLGICVATACALGAYVGSLATERLAGFVIRSLPLLAEYESLKHIDSEDWLEQLEQIEGLTEAFQGSAIGQEPVPTSIPDRKRWQEELEELDRGMLEENAKQFVGLPEERRETLRRISQSIEKDLASREQKLARARAYAAILSERSDLQAGKIKEKATDERLTILQALVDDKLRTLYAKEIPQEDRYAINDWVNGLLEENLELFFTVDTGAPNMFADEGKFSENNIADLVSELSPKAQRLLANQSPADRRLSLGFWVSSVRNPAIDTEVSPEAMFDRLGELGEAIDEDEAKFYERIILLPEYRSRIELRQSMGDALPGITPE